MLTAPPGILWAQGSHWLVFLWSTWPSPHGHSMTAAHPGFLFLYSFQVKEGVPCSKLLAPLEGVGNGVKASGLST